ncbi:hypothetical protein GA0070562_0171 [Micromonospora tulbaghiae]|uniref:Uncharacterized protein n=1 Tax=Micromonospora tulbaghiae TaxID=479978 RepID=A0ABY0KY71_9ACTN|nr:hypothetical protein GA0070562_0171 [Micromonospora tulbaghiae]
MIPRVRKRGAAWEYRCGCRVEEGVTEPEPSCLWRSGGRALP